MKYNIIVFGLGFVGLTTALGFAEKGHKVYGYDINRDRTNTINKGKVPFYEPGLDEALVKHLNKNFVITDDPEEATTDSDFIFLCVGTPCAEDGQADLKYIYRVLDQIERTLKDTNQYRVLVIKSTIPPATTKNILFRTLKRKVLSHMKTLVLRIIRNF